MQIDSHILDDVARVATGAMGAASGLKGELDAMVKRRLEGILAKMDLVPRDEFDAVKEMAANARSESEALAERVAQLEARLAAGAPGRRTMDDRTQTELEAAAFRTLVAHFRKRTDVQNIDLMNLAGFCRNCLSKWYRAAAEDKGIDMDLEEARQRVYGMTYAEWKEHFQTEATPEQKRKYAEEAAKHGF